jgi:hypothetical protein
MSQTTRVHMNELGETGAGINSVDEVDFMQSNKFTNLFSK